MTIRVNGTTTAANGHQPPSSSPTEEKVKTYAKKSLPSPPLTSKNDLINETALTLIQISDEKKSIDPQITFDLSNLSELKVEELLPKAISCLQACRSAEKEEKTKLSLQLTQILEAITAGLRKPLCTANQTPLFLYHLGAIYLGHYKLMDNLEDLNEAKRTFQRCFKLLSSLPSSVEREQHLQKAAFGLGLCHLYLVIHEFDQSEYVISIIEKHRTAAVDFLEKAKGCLSSSYALSLAYLTGSLMAEELQTDETKSLGIERCSTASFICLNSALTKIDGLLEKEASGYEAGYFMKGLIHFALGYLHADGRNKKKSELNLDQAIRGEWSLVSAVEVGVEKHSLLYRLLAICNGMIAWQTQMPFYHKAAEKYIALRIKMAPSAINITKAYSIVYRLQKILIELIEADRDHQSLTPSNEGLKQARQDLEKLLSQKATDHCLDMAKEGLESAIALFEKRYLRLTISSSTAEEHRQLVKAALEVGDYFNTVFAFPIFRDTIMEKLDDFNETLAIEYKI